MNVYAKFEVRIASPVPGIIAIGVLGGVASLQSSEGAYRGSGMVYRSNERR